VIVVAVSNQRTAGTCFVSLAAAQPLLLEAARVLASSLDLEATLGQVTGLLVPRLADYCQVHLSDDGGTLRLASAARTPGLPPLSAEQLDPGGHLPRACRVGRPLMVPDGGPERLPPGVVSSAVVPLVARGRVLGTLWLGSASPERRYDSGDVELCALLEILGARAALALDNARLYAEVHQAHEHELRASQLEVRLTAARLDALRAQLNPHFLFNALNTIAMLVRREANADALRGIVGLSQLLRQMLDRRDAAEVVLGEELALVEHYLAIEQLRYRDRLEVRVDVVPEVLEACVPSLLLQPLVENAVRHGIGSRNGAGWVGIVGRRQGQRLRLEVRDNGPGFPPGWEARSHHGVGLANTRERLLSLYAGDQRLELTNAPSGGAVVAVTIPFRTRHD
jgi:LytS/YehU family sensor histidine kinase